MAKFFLLIITLCLSATFAFAQVPSKLVEKKLSEMQALDELVGVWKGKGWMKRGNQKFHFAGKEVIQKKLNGLTLLVEGQFSAKMPPSNEEKVIHETLAILSYNATKPNVFNFKTYLLNGFGGNHDFKRNGDKWEWGFSNAKSKTRYLIKIENNQWIEIGESSTDGKNWTQFFEMILDKVEE